LEELAFKVFIWRSNIFIILLPFVYRCFKCPLAGFDIIGNGVLVRDVGIMSLDSGKLFFCWRNCFAFIGSTVLIQLYAKRICSIIWLSTEIVEVFGLVI
jgi:hypothetical protein